jgi:hypothetical protein
VPTEAEKQAFKEKLKSLNWGIVPGGYRDRASTSMYDAQDETLSLFPGREEVEDTRHTFYKNNKEVEEG